MGCSASSPKEDLDINLESSAEDQQSERQSEAGEKADEISTIQRATIDNLNCLIKYTQESSKSPFSTAYFKIEAHKKLRDLSTIEENKSRVRNAGDNENFMVELAGVIIGALKSILQQNNFYALPDHEIDTLKLQFEILVNLAGSEDILIDSGSPDANLQSILIKLGSSEVGLISTLTSFLKFGAKSNSSANEAIANTSINTGVEREEMTNSNITTFEPSLGDVSIILSSSSVFQDNYLNILKILWFLSRSNENQTSIGSESQGLIEMLIDYSKIDLSKNSHIDPKTRIVIFKILRNLSLNVENKERMGINPETGFINYLIRLAIYDKDETEAFPLSLQILWFLGKNKKLRKYLLSEELGLSDRLYTVTTEPSLFRREALKSLWSKKKELSKPI